MVYGNPLVASKRAEFYTLGGESLMRSSKFKHPFVLAMSGVLSGLLLMACTKDGDISGAPAARANPGQDSQPSFAQFPDIPIPAEADMDIDRTLVLGGGERWLGRVILLSGNSANAMFNFYKRKMAEHGWQEITSVRSSISVLTFSRSDRIATIQIQNRTLRGAEVRITVSPRDRTPSPAAGSPARGAPMSGSPITGDTMMPPPATR